MRRDADVGMPLSFWIINGRLAEEIKVFISDSKSQATIQKIKEIALSYEQEFMGEPTFAKAVVQLIEKTRADDKTKLALILETANITINLRDLKGP